MKNLVIVESPNKVKTIEKILGKDYTVMSSVGHIRDLRKHGLSIDIENGFKPEYEIPDDKKEIVRKLKSAAKEADIVWLASDEDREGEAIAWHLYEVLGLKPETTRRIVFHEITKPAILNAIANPRDIDINLVDAQQARRMLDRLVGFELSPVLWRKIKPNLSAGRVQSVAVRLICEREKEIKAFESTPYWRITATFTTPSGDSFRAECPTRFESEEDARRLLEECVGATFRIADKDKKPLTRHPAPPFTTSTLQQEAGRKLGFSTSTTMRVAQSLYESGHITYMRTDSTNLSELALRDMAAVISDTYGADYLQQRHYHTKQKGAQEAHEAIRPTYVDKADVPGDDREKRLYRLIRARALASQMADAQIEKTTIRIDILPGADTQKELYRSENNGFRAEGEVVKFDGFMRAYAVSTDDDDVATSNNTLLPDVKVGDDVDRNTIQATERFTTPPARYSEPALVKKMEELGIGRPSTYASTISTILNRDYLTRGESEGKPREFGTLTLKGDKITAAQQTEKTGSDRGKLVPTDIGMVVNDFLTEHFPDILDYNFTAKVEEQFDDIAEGKLPLTDEIDEFYGSFHPYIEQVNALRMEHKAGERILGTDPKTGRRVSVKIGRYGPVVQIGEAKDEEKPLFANLGEGQSIADLTLEEALKLFELPRTLGEFEGETVKANNGRFGPYVQLGKLYASIPKTQTPQEITLEEAIELLVAKREADANKHIKSFDELPGVEVLNGRYGPYIAYKKEGARRAVNYKIPKGTDAATLTAEQVRELMEKQDSAPAKPARRTHKG